MKQHSAALVLLAALSACSAQNLTAPVATATVPQPTAPILCADNASWNAPATPRQIFGNSWYVGTCGISAILITSPQGHILIDSGTEKAAPQVAANIEALGFKVQDVRLLLMSHEHHDHSGGLAYLQQVTTAPLYARAPADAVMRSGKNSRIDPQFLELSAMQPVAKVTTIRNDQKVISGSLQIQALATPGHTPGSTSWTWTSCDEKQCRNMAYIDSLTAISDDQYRYSDDNSHPGYLASFRTALKQISQLPCDILLTPHPGASAMWQRLDANPSQALVNPNGCRDYAANASLKLDKRLAEESSAH
ncbi:subclass B3 metallo-beta-lactamase [Rheinheimera sp. MM224]|uniref:subclass B3 metallo-beta-lactamase n=1 Tax=Rheinheimera sp. MM224 TaxID=3019969 RepID=UPI0021F8C2C9|nr:subclass B3 metallo-beta-lactamase [Rheinheimera sp. MM224]CAI3803913.1 Metallo-beta-lactamase L1 type 3 [Rheinheimera sp. MM224]